MSDDWMCHEMMPLYLGVEMESDSKSEMAQVTMFNVLHDTEAFLFAMMNGFFSAYQLPFV